MNAGTEREWVELAARWQEPQAPSSGEAEIRGLVARQTRRLRLAVAAETVLTIVMMGLALRVVATQGTPAAITWGAIAAGHTAVVWGFTAWNRAGLWRPLSNAVGDYLALAVARCRSEVRASRFACWLIVGESAGVVVWLLMTPRASESTSPGWWWIPPAGVTASVFAWSVWFGRRARREGERLQRLSAGLSD